MVLDKNAIVFTRIWCGFEQATVVQGKKLLLDFATVHEGEAHVLTEGVAADDLKEYGLIGPETGPSAMLETKKLTTTLSSSSQYLLL